MKVSDFFNKLGNSAKSIVKVATLSRKSGLKPGNNSGPLIIMANGPSLNETIAGNLSLLKESDTMSVNFAPLAPVFFDIKPRFHVMADPLFFAEDKPETVKKLYEALKQVDGPMTLLVPCRNRKNVTAEVAGNSALKVCGFNFVGGEGFQWVEKVLYNSKRAMPRPRNVLVPSLMCGIWMGYSEIFIVGADHSWMQTISVDDDNNVISVQPHFYKDDRREQQRIDSAYRNYRLHDIVYSFSVAFRSYHTLNRYAQKKGVRIYNSTPGSFIDAFPRRQLPC